MFNYIFSIPKRINNPLPSTSKIESNKEKEESRKTCAVKSLEKEIKQIYHYDSTNHPLLLN